MTHENSFIIFLLHKFVTTMNNIGDQNAYENAVRDGMPALARDGDGVMVSGAIPDGTGIPYLVPGGALVRGVIPAQVENGGGLGGESSDDESMDQDYASTHALGNISNLEDAKRAIEQLSKQINVVMRENTVVKSRCKSITDAYFRNKGGKRKSVRVNELRGLDQENVLSIRRVVNTVLTRNELILRDGWHIFSEDANTFCQRFIKLSKLRLPNDYVNMYQYYTTVATTHIGSMMGIKRNNLTQKLKELLVGECVCLLLPDWFHDYSIL